MQSSTISTPPIPAYVFRGHNVAIHALHFFAQNHYFVSGDSEGWVVIWRLTTRRPVAVWKAHDGGISGVKDWQGTRLITHGRDHKLRVWQIRDEDFAALSTVLPVDAGMSGNGAGQETQPWLVHSMDVNALNFCAFTICGDLDQPGQAQRHAQAASQQVMNATQQPEPGVKPLLLAAPNGLDQGAVDIFRLPSERRVSKLQSEKDKTSAMVMTLRIFNNNSTGRLTLVAGYEDGSVAVYARKPQNVMPVWIWEKIMSAKPHAQPVLSLDITSNHSHFVTSSADAIVAKFTVPSKKVEGQMEPEKVVNTKHAGQQDLSIRSDGRVLATAGWDKNIRVYSAKTLKELAVLQWHQEGCYALAFAEVLAEGASQGEQAPVAGNAMDRIKQDRDTKVHNTHWLIAGSKDGKISLWDVY